MKELLNINSEVSAKSRYLIWTRDGTWALCNGIELVMRWEVEGISGKMAPEHLPEQEVS